MLQDRLLLSTEKVEELQMALKKATILEVPQLAAPLLPQEKHNIGDKPAVELENKEYLTEEEKIKMEDLVKMYLSDPVAAQNLTSLDTRNL